MILRNPILACLLSCSVLFACGGKSEKEKEEENKSPASSSDGKEETCEEFCDELSACAGVDVDDCTSSCTENESTSRAGQELISKCFSSDLCELDEAAGIDALACFLDELDSLEPSAAAKKYCDSTVPRINECLGSEAPTSPLGDCETQVSLASDELLEELAECAEKSCEDQEFCISLQLIQVVPLDALSGLESGELSPAVLGDLITIGAVFGQLGLEEFAGFEDLIGGGFGTPPAPEGAGGAN